MQNSKSIVAVVCESHFCSDAVSFTISRRVIILSRRNTSFHAKLQVHSLPVLT